MIKEKLHLLEDKPGCYLMYDKNDEIIGYRFVNLGKMMKAIRGGADPKEAYAASIGTYGRYADAVKTIDPRKE